jgi:hypothetical protein
MTLNRLLLRLLAACAVSAPLAQARADRVTVDFTEQTALGELPQASLTLQPNGTILAQITAPAGAQMVAAGFEDPVGADVEGAMDPVSAASASWGNLFGTFDDGVTVTPGATTLSWLIGTPGEFSSVTALTENNSAGYAAFVETDAVAYGGVFSPGAPVAPVPLPAPIWALLGGLAGLGLLLHPQGARMRLGRGVR